MSSDPAGEPRAGGPSPPPAARGAADAPAATAERRLHPLSFLFILIGQLKQFWLPLVVIVVTGRRDAFDAGDLAGLVAVAVLAAVSIAQYFTYRYRIEADGVVIRSGLLQRSLRHIPFGRIQNVSLHQTVLHRLFGVAEVRLESAGAAKPEGQMRVLRLADAQALEQLVRGHAASPAAAREGAPETVASTSADGGAGGDTQVLLHLTPGELVRHGLISNRGLLVVGAGFAAVAQSGDRMLPRLFEAVGRWLTGQASALHLSWIAAVAGATALVLGAVLLLRLLSVVLSLLQFYDYTLSESGGRLRIVRGLATRVRASLPRHRIQAYSLREGLLHRLFKRRSLRVDTAVVETANEARSVRELVPIATPAQLDALIDRLLPERAWPIAAWQPLHPHAWLRQCLLSLVLLVVATAVLVGYTGWIGLLALLLAPLLAWRARLWAAHSAWSVANGLVTFRHGWLQREWRFAEARKLQAIEWTQSPLDRRLGMATLRFDTAGAGPLESGLAIPCLPEATASALYAQLSGALADSRPIAPLIRSRTKASAAPAA